MTPAAIGASADSAGVAEGGRNPRAQRPAAAIETAIRKRLACPRCRTPFSADERMLQCGQCGNSYGTTSGVLDLRMGDHEAAPEFADWSRHWSIENQSSWTQRFFSAYRRAVFARTVAWHIDRFFPASGVFLEAGSGTSETSMRIDKRGGARSLVAADLVLPVVAMAHSIMDVRVAADCFRLPFADGSLDGLWNVGVMEHFEQERIDMMLSEFHRVLRPGAPVCLLWPAQDSLPQKGLRAVETVANLFLEKPIQFHPAEISQLRSSREASEALGRNNFKTVFVDWGWRSLMAFKTVVGRRPA